MDSKIRTLEVVRQAKPITDEAARAEFAKRLTALRITRGYADRRNFARAFGVHEMTYGRWERGETEPTFGMLIRLCQFLETTPDFLLLNRRK